MFSSKAIGSPKGIREREAGILKRCQRMDLVFLLGGVAVRFPNERPTDLEAIGIPKKTGRSLSPGLSSTRQRLTSSPTSPKLHAPGRSRIRGLVNRRCMTSSSRRLLRGIQFARGRDLVGIGKLPSASCCDRHRLRMDRRAGGIGLAATQVLRVESAGVRAFDLHAA